MKNGHLIVGKFSHTIEEIDIAVDKILQDGQIKEVKKPVIFGRCIPMNAQCGSRYYYKDTIKIKRGDVTGIGDIDLSQWYRTVTHYEVKYMDFTQPVIVTIPNDFDYIRFVEDSEYRNSLCKPTDGNIENTAAPYWKIIDGTPVFTKVASLHDKHVKLFKFLRSYKRRQGNAGFSKFRAVRKVHRGFYVIAFATTHRRRRKVWVYDGGVRKKRNLRKCSIISTKWYHKHNPGESMQIQ